MHVAERPTSATMQTMATFEELDYRETELGELELRRRRPVSMPETWVYEVKLAGRFLMSSLVCESEQELARRALARVSGPPQRVLVGGLGLGITAATALEHDSVEQLDVVERLPEVIAWHERELVPLSSTLCNNSRCRLIQGDCFAWLEAAQRASYDAVLIDIDDSPIHLLSEEHAVFYSVPGLRRARRGLRPGGVLAIWTSLPEEPEFTDRMRQAFEDVEVEEIDFENPLLGRDEVNAIYFGLA